MKISLSKQDLDLAISKYVVEGLSFPVGTTVDATFSLTGKARDIVSADVEVYLPGQTRPEPAAKAAEVETATAPAADAAAEGDAVFGS